MNTHKLIQNDVYFLVDKSGNVSQMEYLGYHPDSDHYVFRGLVFCSDAGGDQWIRPNSLQLVKSLGRPSTGAEFNRAIESMLEA